MELPLVAMELKRIGRRASTYWLRAVAPAAAFSVFGFYFQINAQTQFAFHSENIGQHIVTLVIIVLALVIFLGLPFVGAVQIAQEKEDRSLGLLLLADHSGRDVFLSRYAAVIVYGLCLVASGLPMVMLSLYFGVTTAHSVILQIALLVAIVLAMSALSMFWSTLASDPRTALFATFACLAVFLVGSSHATYVWSLPLNPLHLLFMAPATLEANALFLCAHIAGAAVLALMFLLLALHTLPGMAYAEPAVVRLEARSRDPRWLRWLGPTPSPMIRLLEVAMARPGFGTRRVPRRRGWIGLSLLALLLGPLMIPLLVVLIAFDVATNMRTLFVHGIIDDIRTLPIRDCDVGGSIHDAHRRRAVVYVVPATCSGIGAFVGLGVAIVRTQSWIAGVVLVLAAAVYFLACTWLVRSVVSVTCDCARNQRRVTRVTATAVSTFAGFLLAWGYVGMIPAGIVVAVVTASGLGFMTGSVVALLLIELTLVLLFRHMAANYEGTFIRLYERDIYALAEQADS